MKRYLVGLLGFLMGTILMAAPPQAPPGSWTVIFSGYTGAPAPPTSFPSSNAAFPGNVISIGAEVSKVSIQISDASGADGSGVVDILTRDCPVADTTCGWYVTQTCTNPPDATVNATRCDFIIEDARLLKLQVTSYVSGTFQAGIRTKVQK